MKIAVLDGFTLNPGDNPWTGLEQLGEVEVFDRTNTGELVERAKDAGILVINKVRITEGTLRQLPNLKFITVTATGFDCVDSSAAKQALYSCLKRAGVWNGLGRTTRICAVIAHPAPDRHAQLSGPRWRRVGRMW